MVYNKYIKIIAKQTESMTSYILKPIELVQILII